MSGSSRLVASRFNVPSDSVSGGRLIYNTLTQNLIHLEDAQFRELAAGRLEDPEFRRLGFVVGQSHSEVDAAFELRRAMRQRPDRRLVVSVVPSLGCNFACGYCFNGLGHEKRASGLAVDSALAHVSKELRPGEPLRVIWYGGEPTLFMREVRRATAGFLEICEAHGSNYDADVLTNGSTLSEELSRTLVEVRVRQVQVSVDWPLEHSARHVRGQSALQALRQTLAKFDLVPESIELVLRVNAIPGFSDSFSDLLSDVERRVSRSLYIYVHRVYESNASALNTDASKRFRYSDHVHFFDEYLRAKEMLRSRGFAQEYFPTSFIDSVCIAERSRSGFFVPSGEQRKCFQEVAGPGAVQSSNGELNDVGRYYLENEVGDDPVCTECTYLPICFGGCPKERLEFQEERERRCIPWKFTLQRELTLYLQRHLAEFTGDRHEETEA